MPLGLELAAAWVLAFTPQDIAEELERSLGFLQTSRLLLRRRRQQLQPGLIREGGRVDLG